jgi:hypothetical protein
VGILGGIFFSENYCRIYSSITVLLCSSVISDHEQPIRCNSVGSQLPRRCMRCEAAKPRANQAPSWRGDTPSDKVLSGVMRGWFPLVPPSPPFPFAVSAQIRMAVVTTRCLSTLTDFYDLHLSLAVLGPRRPFPCCFPCWLGCHSANRPSLPHQFPCPLALGTWVWSGRLVGDGVTKSRNPRLQSNGSIGFCPKSRPQPVGKHLRSEIEGGVGRIDIRGHHQLHP